MCQQRRIELNGTTIFLKILYQNNKVLGNSRLSKIRLLQGYGFIDVNLIVSDYFNILVTSELSFTVRIESKTTLLWSIKKQKWLVGPKIPDSYDIYQGCAVPIDKNIVIIMGLIVSHGDEANNVVSFNIESNKWIRLKNSPSLNYYGFIDYPDRSCSCTFEKSYDM